MKFSKAFWILLILVVCASSAEIAAQESKLPKQIKILNNYGEIPFEDGKTDIAEVLFVGLDSDFEKYNAPIGKPITEKAVFSLLESKNLGIKAGDKFYGYKVSKAVKSLRKLINSIGYPESKINAFGEVLPKNQMKLIISVERGTPILVSEIRFEGNEKITNEELVTNLMGCLRENWIEYQESTYKFYAQNCSREYLFKKGFFEAVIKDIIPQKFPGGYIVKIVVEEGVRYRVGVITIKYAKVFSQNEIIEMLGINVGDVLDGKKIRDFLFNDLRDKYSDKGYIEYDVELNPTFAKPISEGLDGIVNVEIILDEGAQFRVGSIEFVGVENAEHKRLKNLFTLKEGEIYNRSKLNKSIDEVNKLAEFYPIDCDQDIETEAINNNFSRQAVTDGTARPTLRRRIGNLNEVRVTSKINLRVKVRRLTENERVYYKELLKGRSCSL